MTPPAAEAPAPGRIGPNAIIRMAEALRRFGGPALAEQLFVAAGLAEHWRQMPEAMVDEREAARLHALVRQELGADAPAVSRDAGRATADYLLAHRIPAPVQALLRRLPAPLAARVLLGAIRRHAWTFAGSGRFEARAGRPVVLTIHGNPLCRGLRTEAPACDYYAATFERLFRVLVHPRTTVTETACEARGDAACTFVLDWRRGAPAAVQAPGVAT